MYRLKALATIPFLLLLFMGCEVFNPDEELPAYITIQNAKVELNESTGFTTDLGLRDVWVYQANQLQGVYELPATFPYLDLEKTDFFLQGGIYESGLSAFHIPYPFWERIDLTIAQSPGDTMVIEPTFKYFNSNIIEFPINENFEGQDINFAPFAYFNGDTARLRKSSQDPYRGNFCGIVRFDDDSRHFEVASINPNPMILNDQEDAYIEITYKSEVEFQVGLVYSNSSEGIGISPALTVLPKSGWNTVYVHIIDNIRARRDANTSFNIWLKAETEGEDATLQLDDIRLIRFQ